VILHKRSDWTSAEAASPHRFDPGQVRGVAVHWNGPAVPQSAFTDPRAYLEGVRRYHTATKGWSDIAYNYGVDQRGHVWELRGMRLQSAANGDQAVNAAWVAVLGIIGEGQRPSEAMLNGIAQTVAKVRGTYPQASKVKGHRDVRPGSTACPGPYLYRAVNDGRLQPARKATQEETVTSEEIDKIAEAVWQRMAANEKWFVDKARRALDAELGDESSGGEFSTKVAGKAAKATVDEAATRLGKK